MKRNPVLVRCGVALTFVPVLGFASIQPANAATTYTSYYACTTVNGSSLVIHKWKVVATIVPYTGVRWTNVTHYTPKPYLNVGGNAWRWGGTNRTLRGNTTIAWTGAAFAGANAQDYLNGKVVNCTARHI